MTMRQAAIKVTSINRPSHDGTVWYGTAESAAGDRYRWAASPERHVASCFREDESGFLLQERASAALVGAVQDAIRAAAPAQGEEQS
jgi:hypothetical protein